MTDIESALSLIMEQMRSTLPVWPTHSEFAAYALVQADPAHPNLEFANAIALVRSQPVAALDSIFEES